MIKVNYKDITFLEIDSNFLEFMTKDGKEIKIDFRQCRKNWIKYVNESADFSRSDLKERETKCIGERNCLGNPLYINLYSDPIMRIEFRYKQTISEKLLGHDSGKAYKEFRKLQDNVVKGGWTTFDLT